MHDHRIGPERGKLLEADPESGVLEALRLLADVVLGLEARDVDGV